MCMNGGGEKGKCGDLWVVVDLLRTFSRRATAIESFLCCL